MRIFPGKQYALLAAFGSILIITTLIPPMHAQQISLQALVTPSTIIVKDGHPVTFALHGFIEFKSLSELFPYIDSQTERWRNKGRLHDASRPALARGDTRR